MRWTSVAQRGGSILTLLLLTACDAQPRHVSANEPAAEMHVAVAQAERATFGERFSISGTLTAERQAQLSPRADGLVSLIHVDSGEFVDAGQTLAELDPTVVHHGLLRIRAEAIEADAAVREAERLVLEAQRLNEQRAIAATEVGARTAALDLARAVADFAHASVREQEEIVARHMLPAPFPGVIAEKHAEVGEWVQRGTPVLTLVSTDRVRLDLRVPQERFSQIDEDAQVRVFSDALDGTSLPARVSARVPVTDPGTRTFLLRLLVDVSDGYLLPGTSARAEISLAQTDTSAIAISRDAVLRQPDGNHSVYVVEDVDGQSVARRHTVRILNDLNGQVAVVGDAITEDSWVVIRGNETLADGQPVHVVER